LDSAIHKFLRKINYPVALLRGVAKESSFKLAAKRLGINLLKIKIIQTVKDVVLVVKKS